MKYTVIIEKGNESGYVAYVPALKGFPQGKTKAATMRNIKEAMGVYIEALLEDGLPVPTEVGKDTLELEVAIIRRDNPFAQVVVPDHKSVDTGTLANILDGAGISVEEFLELTK